MTCEFSVPGVLCLSGVIPISRLRPAVRSFLTVRAQHNARIPRSKSDDGGGRVEKPIGDHSKHYNSIGGCRGVCPAMGGHVFDMRLTPAYWCEGAPGSREDSGDDALPESVGRVWDQHRRRGSASARALGTTRKGLWRNPSRSRPSQNISVGPTAPARQESSAAATA